MFIYSSMSHKALLLQVSRQEKGEMEEVDIKYIFLSF